MKILSKIYRNNGMLLREGVESKNMAAAKHYLYNTVGMDEERAMQVIGLVKHDIPNSRLAKCKFMLALVRMYLNGDLSEAEIIFDVNKTLRIATSDAHVNEYDQNLNGLSAQQFINKFATFLKQDLEKDKKDVSSQTYDENQSAYDIVKIDSFEESERYGEYCDWCVTSDEKMYDQYTCHGTGVFYFCLKRGFENVPKEKGENCPLDEYGLSMIAVCVNADGSCNAITCRWNHENKGSDTVMTPKQLSMVVNRNFYETFRPLTPEEIAAAKERVLWGVKEDVEELMDYESLDDFCEGVGSDDEDNEDGYGSGGMYPYYIFRDDRKDVMVVLDSKGKIIGDEVFDDINYVRSPVGRIPLFFVMKGNSFNIMKGDGTMVSDNWYGRITIPKYNTISRSPSDMFFVGNIIDGKVKWNLMDINGRIVLKEWFNALDTYILNGKYVMAFFGGESYGNNATMNSSMNYLNIQTQNFVFNKNISDFERTNDRDVFIKFEGDNYFMCYSTSNFTLRAPWKFTGYGSGYDGYGVKTPGGYFSTRFGYKIKLLDDGVEYILGDIINYDLLRGRNHTSSDKTCDFDDFDDMVVVKKNPYNAINGPYGPYNITESRLRLDSIINEAIQHVISEAATEKLYHYIKLPYAIKALEKNRLNLCKSEHYYDDEGHPYIVHGGNNFMSLTRNKNPFEGYPVLAYGDPGNNSVMGSMVRFELDGRALNTYNNFKANNGKGRRRNFKVVPTDWIYNDLGNGHGDVMSVADMTGGIFAHNGKEMMLQSDEKTNFGWGYNGEINDVYGHPFSQAEERIEAKPRIKFIPNASKYITRVDVLFCQDMNVDGDRAVEALNKLCALCNKLGIMFCLYDDIKQFARQSNRYYNNVDEYLYS